MLAARRIVTRTTSSSRKSRRRPRHGRRRDRRHAHDGAGVRLRRLRRDPGPERRTRSHAEPRGGWRSPVVLFAEGGGGARRPQTCRSSRASTSRKLSSGSRLLRARPRVRIVSLLRGNAALLGLCDVMIATEDSTIGMERTRDDRAAASGPSRPRRSGRSICRPNGVVDVRVRTRRRRSRSRSTSGTFEPPSPAWTATDQTPPLRIDAGRRRRVSRAADRRADLRRLRPRATPRPQSMLTALARIEERAVGCASRTTAGRAGAIDSDTPADKTRLSSSSATRSASSDLPLRHAGVHGRTRRGDRPGEAHHARMFVAAASLTVPHLTIVLQKGVWPRCTSDGRRSSRRRRVRRVVADRRVRSDGPEGAVKLAMGRLAAMPNRSGPRRGVQGDGRLRLRPRQGDETPPRITRVDAVIDRPTRARGSPAGSRSRWTERRTRAAPPPLHRHVVNATR